MAKFKCAHRNVEKSIDGDRFIIEITHECRDCGQTLHTEFKVTNYDED